MGHVRDSFYVDAPPDAVWSIGADPRRTVERAERPRYAEASATTPLGGTARQVVHYQPEGNGTRVNIDVEYEIAPGLLGQVVSKVFAERSLERDIRHSGENFKALVEELRGRVPVA